MVLFVLTMCSICMCIQLLMVLHVSVHVMLFKHVVYKVLIRY